MQCVCYYNNSSLYFTTAFIGLHSSSFYAHAMKRKRKAYYKNASGLRFFIATTIG